MSKSAMKWYVGNEWQCEPKGLHKKVLAFNFIKIEKPHVVSKVKITVKNIVNLNGRKTKYLQNEFCNEEQILEMGAALTPIDCYLEILLQQMIVGEHAICTIKTRNDNISFEVTLNSIEENREIFKLSVKEMYELALHYKENGVLMFKEYPLFAHDYFVRAIKCLISYKPFEPITREQDEVAGEDMEKLCIQIKTNLAACLLNQKRYEDVIYQTQFVETLTEPSEKSIYRRALAQMHIKEYEAALKTIEKVPNYQEKKEFHKLHQRTTEEWKTSKDHYKNLVQRMFN